MSFNANYVLNNTDESTVEHEGPRYPIITWITGDPKAKKIGGMAYHGGFFVSKEGAPSDLTEYGWEAESLVRDDGKEIEGYWRKQAEMALIMGRKRWVVQGNSGQMVFGWNDYAKAAGHGGPRSHQQTLVLVKGMEELGSFVLSLKGTAMMSLNGQKEFAAKGVISNLRRVIIAAFNKALQDAAKKVKGGSFVPAPYRIAWCPIVADNDGKEPMFTKVGHGDKFSMVVLPVIGEIPVKPEAVDLDAFYVSDAIYAQVNEIYAENVEWAQAWDDLKPGAVEADSDHDAEPQEDLSQAAAEAGL
ncbi:MAG: hypothetical protein KDE53_04660 [Caldilineaceae bacterium]|nr:hypothetical protein [Caldilineaceae bacterium]